MYDSIVITLILAADLAGAWLSWKHLQEKQRTRIKRIVRDVLKMSYLRSH